MENLIEMLREGKHLERPDRAPNTVATLMFDCWHIEPNARPMFDQLEKAMKDLLVK